MARLFGTDGVRGIANLELTPELAFDLGKAGATVLSQERNERPVFVVGMDTRRSGDLLENAISAGILAVGGDVIKVGILPTPAVAYLVRHYDADAGIVISASHNPYEYNGIKFFNNQGFKLDDEIEEAIEDIILRHIDTNNHVTHDQVGRVREADKGGLEVYVNYLVSKADYNFKNRKIILDCANGAAFDVAPKVFERLGAKVISIGNSPNGVNINLNCGSTQPRKLQEKVISEGAFMGLAFDGDADRLIAVDEKGRIIDGDKLICICAKMLKDEGSLGNGVVTGTLMSNLGFHKYIRELGCETRSTNVGDRYVLEDMLKTGSLLGGEQSGHIIFRSYSTTGDGILAGIQVAGAVIKSGKTASEVSGEIKIYPQVLKNARVDSKNKLKYENDREMQAIFQKTEKRLEGRGRLLIRPSGTEPLVRVMIEGDDIGEITKLAEELALLLTKKFG